MNKLLTFAVTLLSLPAFAQSIINGVPNQSISPSGGGSNAVQSFPAFNDATGTSVNTLASWVAGVKPGTIHTTPTSGSNGTDSSPSIVGVVIAGAGTSGLATVQYAGSVQWICDDQTIVGDQVQPSISTAGYCHDPGGGSTAQQVNENPESNSFLGRVTVANTGSGTASTITLYQYTGYGTVGNIGNQYGSSLFTLQQGQGSPYLTSSWWAQENSTHALVGATPIKLGLTSTGFYYDNEGPNSGLGVGGYDWLFDVISHGPGQGGNDPGGMIRFNGSTYNVPKVASVSGAINAGSGGSCCGYYPGETTGNFIYTLTGNATFPNPGTSEQQGHILTFELVQAPSGGPYTFSWGTAYQNAPTMCTTASCVVNVQFYYDGANYQCLTGCASTAAAVTWATPTAGTATSKAIFPGGDLFNGGVNAQTGTSYTVVAADENKTLTLSNASAVAVSLPVASTTGFTAGAVFDVVNLGAGSSTITPTTSTINGASSLVLATGQSARITSNGTNYFAELGAGAGGVTGTSPIVVTGSNISCPTCSTGTGSNVTVNGGSSLGTAALNGTTPAAPAGNTNITWQVSGSNVSAYVPAVVNITPQLTASGCTVSGYICTVGSAGATVSFSSIPAGYSALKLLINGRSSNTTSDLYIQFNGDTGANYDFQLLFNSAGGTPAAFSGNATASPLCGMIANSGATSGASGSSEITIPNYSGTTFWKQPTCIANRRDSTSLTIAGVSGVTWHNTAAITSMAFNINAGSNNFVVGTTFSVYGIP